MRKILFILASVLIIIVIFLLLAFLSTIKKSEKAVAPQEINPSPTIPQGQTIEISQIPLNNFYKSASKIDSQQDAYIVNIPKKYQILYMPKFNSFLIGITGSPFEPLREEAEKILLEKTGLSQSDACSLDIKITTPHFVNPDYSGKSYPLSFCQK